MSLAFLFPGQGAQHPGMLRALPESPSVSAVLRESRSWLTARGLPTGIDDDVALRDTTNVQLALLIAGVACARALTDDHGLAPQFVAGHSVGCFAAAVTAGALTLPEALAAVELRAELMKEACSRGDWGMAVVTGLPARPVRQMTEQLHTDVWMANINSATQTVLSGSRAALPRAAQAAEDAGAADFEILDVAVASHCPLQADSASRMAAHLAALPRRPLKCRYLTNTGGRAVDTADAILTDLAHAVAHPVQWYDATRLMPELGVTCAVETRPGHVLTRLNAANAPAVTTLALQDNDLESVVVRIRRHAEHPRIMPE